MSYFERSFPRFMWLRGKQLRDIPTGRIVSDLVQNGFNGVVCFPSTWTEAFYDTVFFPTTDARRGLFSDFVREAQDAGLKVIQGFAIGHWARWDNSLLPNIAEWNIRNDPVLGADYDWLNFSLPDVRDFLPRMIEEAMRANNPDGWLLDYIRTAKSVPEHRGQHVHVTAAVRSIAAMSELLFPGALRCATVFRASGGWSGLKRYELYSQYWPTWADWIHRFFVTVYNHPDDLLDDLDQLPVMPQVTIKLTPGGGSTSVPNPLTASEFERSIRIVQGNTWYGTPALWHYGLMQQEHFEVYRRMCTGEEIEV